MGHTYGYVRPSRQRIAGEAGSDSELQTLQLRGAGGAPEASSQAGLWTSGDGASAPAGESQPAGDRPLIQSLGQYRGPLPEGGTERLMPVPFAYRRLGARDKSLTVAKTSYHEQVATSPMKPHQDASRSGNLPMAGEMPRIDGSQGQLITLARRLARWPEGSPGPAAPAAAAGSPPGGAPGALADQSRQAMRTRHSLPW